MFPSQVKNQCKEKLLCDVCELAKHTRSNYPSSNERSKLPFDVVHSDVWGPSVVTALTGDRYYVTFIDGFSRCTWLYLLKHKSEVLHAFKDFFNMVRNQFGVNVKILRSDNGTEYVNGEFNSFLSSYGIIHQTTCVNTAEQNGVAERKNRHLLEVARAIMFMMNVPKFLWGEAVKTAAYLINRMPSRILGQKTPTELLHGSNSFIVPPKIFGCTCFVHDYRSSAGKLDPRSVKCIFVGYSPTKKGYRCWSPAERKFFVSMDVTFHEKEPFYSFKQNGSDTCSKGENLIKESNNKGSAMIPIVDIIRSENETEGENTANTSEEGENTFIPEVYENISGQHGVETNDGEGVSLDIGEGATSQPQVLEEAPISEDMAHDEGGDEGIETHLPSSSTEVIDEPIALRKRKRIVDVPARLKDCVGYKHDLAKVVSYDRCSSLFRSFIASLDATSVPKEWKDAVNDPKWKAAMLEEMNALEKNKTWELVEWPKGKEPVGCKWVYTIKYNPEGKIERYKARLVAKGYTQTYGVDYEETFAPVAKMNTVRTLISCAANLGWNLFQMDVKNAFLHGELQEEIYMHIPPGFNTRQTEGKVLKLHRSLYGLKQSPRAWFDRFRKAVLKLGFMQSNADHTLFYRRCGGKLTVLIVYVDDIIITGDDDQGIEKVKQHLTNEFEVKDLGQMRYFLGIEVSRSSRGIYLSQRKYVLDLLSETGMSGCRPALTPIEKNHRLTSESGEPVDREQYQRLVGRLIYLSHTRPDIAFAVSVVSQFMHNPKTHHMDAVNRIIRYLKGCPGRGLLYKSCGNLKIECYTDADWAGSLDDRRSTSGYCTFLGGNLVTWRSKKQNVVARSTAEAEYRAMAHGVCEVLWLKIILMELGLFQAGPLMMYCDNKAALDIAHNPVQHGRTKHIEIDRHFIKEKLDQGIICMPYVSSSNQLADILTKGLVEKVFSSLCSKMGLYDVFAPS
jgi:hypothetical protein